MKDIKEIGRGLIDRGLLFRHSP